MKGAEPRAEAPTRRTHTADVCAAAWAFSSSYPGYQDQSSDNVFTQLLLLTAIAGGWGRSRCPPSTPAFVARGQLANTAQPLATPLLFQGNLPERLAAMAGWVDLLGPCPWEPYTARQAQAR